MASVKSTALVAVLLLLNCHWVQCQYCYAGPGYGYPIIADGCDNDGGLDSILPLLILAFAGRGGGFGGRGGYGGYGYGGGCGCGGCGAGNGGCGGGCNGGCGCGGC